MGYIGLGINLTNNMSLTGNRAFTPASLFSGGATGVWYDPSDLSTMHQTGTRAAPGAAVAVGDPVGLILDKSGNEIDAVQATSAARPILRQSGSLYYLEFDGVDDGLRAAALDLSASTALGLAAAFTVAGTTAQIVIEHSDNFNSNADAFIAYMDGAKIVCGVQAGAAYDTITSDATYDGVKILPSFQSLDITQAAATSKLPLRVNGAAETVTVTNDGLGARATFGNYPLSLGARAGTSTPANVDFYGLVLRGTPFSATELANAEEWMAAKAGITL